MTGTGRDAGVSQILVIGIIGAVALLLIGVLTIPMLIGGSSLLFSAATGGLGCSSNTQKAKDALQSKVSTDAKNSIPANYLAWYQKVGTQYGVPWLLLAGIGLVVGFGRVVGRQLHDLRAEGGDAEPGADESGEAVPELGELIDRLRGVAGDGLGHDASLCYFLVGFSPIAGTAP